MTCLMRMTYYVPTPVLSTRSSFVPRTQSATGLKLVLQVLSHSDFCNLRCALVRTLTLNLEFSHLSIFYWQMYLSQSSKPQWMQIMGEEQSSDEEQDSFKETLLETNPYLLGMTVAVSLLHTVFEFLAFKNG